MDVENEVRRRRRAKDGRVACAKEDFTKQGLHLTGDVFDEVCQEFEFYQIQFAQI